MIMIIVPWIFPGNPQDQLCSCNLAESKEEEGARRKRRSRRRCHNKARAVVATLTGTG